MDGWMDGLTGFFSDEGEGTVMGFSAVSWPGLRWWVGRHLPGDGGLSKTTTMSQKQIFTQTTDEKQMTCETATIDCFKSTSFLLICLIIWPQKVHVREISLMMKRRYKLGSPMCMFTQALSFQIKPEGYQGFTSCHFCSTGQRSSTKHNHWSVFLLHLQDTKARVLSTCLSMCL